MSPRYWVLVVMAVLFLLFGLFRVNSCLERRWHKYIVEHKCKNTGEVRTQTTTMFTNVGSATAPVFVPIVSTYEETRWECDNGEVWR